MAKPLTQRTNFMTDEKYLTLESLLVEQKRRVDELMLRLAVKDEREKHIDEKLGKITRDVEEVGKLLARLGWIVIAAVIGGAMKFVLDGGLHIGP
jgi:hypothetical protein